MKVVFKKYTWSQVTVFEERGIVMLRRRHFGSKMQSDMRENASINFLSKAAATSEFFIYRKTVMSLKNPSICNQSDFSVLRSNVALYFANKIA